MPPAPLTADRRPEVVPAALAAVLAGVGGAVAAVEADLAPADLVAEAALAAALEVLEPEGNIL